MKEFTEIKVGDWIKFIDEGGFILMTEVLLIKQQFRDGEMIGYNIHTNHGLVDFNSIVEVRSE
jgi:hypothetical protein